jgi:hypothetical protein
MIIPGHEGDNSLQLFDSASVGDTNRDNENGDENRPS